MKTGLTDLNLIMKESFKLFSLRDKIKLLTVAGLGILSALLDLAAVLLIGAMGSIAIRGIQSKEAGDRVKQVLDFLGVETTGFRTQIFILGILAASLLIFKTILSAYIARRTLVFLANRAAHLSGKALASVSRFKLDELRTFSSQEFFYGTTVGVNSISIGIVGSVVNAISDIAIFLILTFGLFIVNPMASLGTFLTFSLIAFILGKTLNQRAVRISEARTLEEIRSTRMIFDFFNAFREFHIRNRSHFITSKIAHSRAKMAKATADISFLPSVSKYVLEIVLILGSFVIAGIQFASSDASTAIATLVMFMASGSRIGPAVLRMQSGVITLKSSIPPAIKALNLIKQSTNVEDSQEFKYKRFNQDHTGFKGNIEAHEVSFSYPDGNLAISNISLNIKEGEYVGIIGPSGSGKSTLVDLILGMYNPKTGSIKISSLKPDEVIKEFPGAIGYVPQEVFLVEGTLKENVALGYEVDEIEDSQILESLESAQLGDFLLSLPNGMYSKIGDGARGISGGQRQRIGIARALLSKPSILILDEATSALDFETEKDFLQVISNLEENCTILTITHRLSSLIETDRVLVIESSKIVDEGSYDYMVDKYWKKLSR
jgi:ATP-binding cassette subfamily C protein